MWENKKEMPNHDDGLFLPKKIRGFHGTPKKIRLESNNISYGSCPAPDDEVEQHLTINDHGRMWLTVFRFGSGFAQHKQCRAISHAIGKSKAQRILAAIAQHFVDYQPCFATDVGVWKLCITNTENEKFLYHGSLCQCDFDGNGQCRPDPIECLTIDYHRLSVPKAVAHETERCMVWEYKEKLTICRETDTIEYIQTISPECVASHKYHVAYGISDLLDTFSTDSFFRYTLQTPDDVVENPDERREYTLTVAFQRRPPLQLQGVYDKYDLPLGWNEMIEKIWSFIRFYGLCGEIMDPEVYNSVRRRKSDLIFLYV